MITGLVTLQVVMLVVLLGAYAAVRWLPLEARGLQRAMIVAVPLSLLARPALVESPLLPAAQVWAPLGASSAPHLSWGAGPAVPVPVEAAFPLGALWAAVALVPLARALLALWALGRGAVRLRRCRGVEVWIAPAARAPFAVWWGRPIVVLDPDTAFDPELSRLALRHELQHHRQGDPRFAWLLVALALVSPVAWLLRRPLAQAEEIAVDRALVTRGTPPRRYADALVRLALRGARTSTLAPGMAAFLPRRISMLIDPAPSRPLHRHLAQLAVALVLLGAAPLGWAADGLLVDHRVSDARFAAAAARLDAGGAFTHAEHPRVRAALDDIVATPKGRAWAEATLERAQAVAPAIVAELAAAGLPVELRAVPFEECGYRNCAETDLPATVPPQHRGAGYWMFIRTTARAYGLRVDDAVDERRDLGLQTAAAIDYLGAMHARFGDWGLALAAYNQGESAVARAVRSGGTRDAFALQEAGLLNDYVADVYAAEMLMADPTLLE